MLPLRVLSQVGSGSLSQLVWDVLPDHPRWALWDGLEAQGPLSPPGDWHPEDTLNWEEERQWEGSPGKEKMQRNKDCL